MRKTIFLLCVLFFICMPVACADDIVFSLDQKEYYFLVGQDAIIPLKMNNSYDETVRGTMGYTITQEVNQNGFQYSSSKTHNQPFTVQQENTTVNLNFGTSDSPLTLRINMLFSYNDGYDKIVELDDISIYFVSNQSQMNNQQNPQQSSSEKVTQGQQSNQNDQQQQQTPQQQLQNNQMNQDSSALKEQIQNQLQQQQQMTKEFEQELFNNSDFQKKHQDLLDKGYEVSDKHLNPRTNNSGDFNLSYKNNQGKNASLSGSMDNGEITSMQSLTEEDRQQMLHQLQNNSQFQKFNKSLSKDGFNQTSIEYHQDGNITELKVQYQNANNETAVISAEFYDEELQSVILEKQDQLNLFVYVIPIVSICAIIILIYLYYRRKRIDSSKDSDQIKPTKPFDYKKEADLLLQESERLFKKKQYKDAYGKAGQALRLFLSYHYGLNKETTNDEIISYLQNKRQQFDHIRSCFNLCSLVEFAKYKANDKDFNSILTIAKKTIYNRSLQSNDM